MNFALVAQQLASASQQLLAKSPFADFALSEWDSFPSGGETRDSDTEDAENHHQEGGATPTSFDCDATEILGASSDLFDSTTVGQLTEWLEHLTSVVRNPAQIAQITAKELPNRIRFESRQGRRGAHYISQLFAELGIVRVALGLLHVPRLTAEWPFFAALSEFLMALTESREGLLLFAADHKAANMIVETLLSTFAAPLVGDPALTRNLPLSRRTDVDTPIQLGACLAIRLQDWILIFLFWRISIRFWYSGFKFVFFNV